MILTLGAVLFHRAALEVVSLRQRLDGETAETRSVQAQLQATADEFRSCHQQRRTLMDQFEAATASIRKCVAITAHGACLPCGPDSFSKVFLCCKVSCSCAQHHKALFPQ